MEQAEILSSSSASQRLTAQAAFEVTSAPNGWQQLHALLLKNIKVRSRDIVQTANAFIEPIWMMLLLVFLHLSYKAASSHMQVDALPYLSVNTCPSTADCTFFGYTGVPPSDPIVAELSSLFAVSEPQQVVPTYFLTETAMNAAYDQSPRNFVVGVVFFGPTSQVFNSVLAPDKFKYAIKTNHTTYLNNDYFKSRFLTAQAYVERAAINVRRKANNKPPLSSPLPSMDPGNMTSDAGRSFISYARFVFSGATAGPNLNAFYIIFTFQTVWLGVLSILVVEKKKKIRAGMSMMGLDSNAYLISIWLMQNVQNMVTCALMAAVLFVGHIFTASSVFIVYLLLVLFSFNATAFGTMASVLIPDPKKTNQASLLLLTINVGAYAASEYVLAGSVNPTNETLFFLLPSVALGRCISYISTSEFASGGVMFTNFGTGPCGRAILMLLVDCVIYYFLAWYLDGIFPGEYGHALPYDFFLRPSYWRLGEYHDRHTCSSSTKQVDLDETSPMRHPDMFEQFDLSHIPEKDRGVIRVTGLRKSFKSNIGWAYSIPLLGLFFRAFYPPSISRKTGPFAGHKPSEVVAGLDLEVHRNEILGFLGHNGAGKTTALSIIMGVINPTVGRVIVDGHLLPGSSGVKLTGMDLWTLSEVQKTMGICPQQDVLFESLTAWETVQLYAAIKGVKVLSHKANGTKSHDPESSKKLLDEYLQHLLEDVYLYENRHEQIKTLSGGMKRKLSVALAFLGDPKVVLLDEPTSGMDVFTRKQVWQLMQQSKVGRSILLTTHSMEEADALGDRIAILSKGKLQTLGSSLFLKNRFGVGYRLNLEKRRVMLAEQPCPMDVQAGLLRGDDVLFDVAKTTAIVQEHFPDAVIDADTATEITYVLPTTGTAKVSGGRAAQEYIRDRKTDLPGLFEHLDREIASSQLGIKSIGLALTTLEEVFIRLQEQEMAEQRVVEDQEGEKGT